MISGASERTLRLYELYEIVRDLVRKGTGVPINAQCSELYII